MARTAKVVSVLLPAFSCKFIPFFGFNGTTPCGAGK